MIALYTLLSLPLSNTVVATPSKEVEFRNFQHISVNQDGNSLLVTECVKMRAQNCFSFAYDIQKNEGKLIPSSEPALDAISAEYDGQAIVVSEYSAQNNQSKIGQITDGAYAHLFVTSGLVKSPRRRNDDSFIYWKGVESNGWVRYDLMKKPFGSSSENFLVGPHGFYSYGTYVTLRDGRVLMSGDGPFSIKDIFTYKRRFNGSETYSTKEGEGHLPRPMFTDIEYAKLPRLTMAENVFIVGQDNSGMHIYKYSIEGRQIDKHKIPAEVGVINYMSEPTKTNSIYVIAQPRDGGREKYVIARLNLKNSTWSLLAIPRIAATIGK